MVKTSFHPPFIESASWPPVRGRSSVARGKQQKPLALIHALSGSRGFMGDATRALLAGVVMSSSRHNTETMTTGTELVFMALRVGQGSRLTKPQRPSRWAF